MQPCCICQTGLLRHLQSIVDVVKRQFRCLTLHCKRLTKQIGRTCTIRSTEATVRCQNVIAMFAMHRMLRLRRVRFQYGMVNRTRVAHVPGNSPQFALQMFARVRHITSPFRQKEASGRDILLKTSRSLVLAQTGLTRKEHAISSARHWVPISSRCPHFLEQTANC